MEVSTEQERIYSASTGSVQEDAAFSGPTDMANRAFLYWLLSVRYGESMEER